MRVPNPLPTCARCISYPDCMKGYWQLTSKSISFNEWNGKQFRLWAGISWQRALQSSRHSSIVSRITAHYTVRSTSTEMSGSLPCHYFFRC